MKIKTLLFLFTLSSFLNIYFYLKNSTSSSQHFSVESVEAKEQGVKNQNYSKRDNIKKRKGRAPAIVDDLPEIKSTKLTKDNREGVYRDIILNWEEERENFVLFDLQIAEGSLNNYLSLREEMIINIESIYEDAKNGEVLQQSQIQKINQLQLTFRQDAEKILGTNGYKALNKKIDGFNQEMKRLYGENALFVSH